MKLTETELIERIRRRVRRPRRSAVVVGIGDDCAVLRLGAGSDTLVTTDFTLEGTHFRREWHPPAAVGHRCLARGLSDIAAMAGEPVAAFLSLAVPAGLPQKWVDGFLRGLLRLAERHRVVLAGGDVSESSDGVLADIMVLGRVPTGRAALRSGARPGDSLYVTGELGRSALVLAALREQGAAGLKAVDAAWRVAHLFPEPRVEVGTALRGVASAMIDISDGLSTDLGHLCEQSGVGALVHEYSIPRPVGTRTNTLHFALHGGDDYELLFTVPRGRTVPARIGKVRLTRIGEIVKGNKMWLLDSHGQRKPLKPSGWQHFGSR